MWKSCMALAIFGSLLVADASRLSGESAIEKRSKPVAVEAPRPSFRPHRPETSRRSLLIDVGRFTPFGRGIRIQIGKRADGERDVHVDIKPEVAPDVDVEVDVQSREARQGGADVEVDVRRGRSRVRRRPPSDAPGANRPRRRGGTRPDLGPGSEVPPDSDAVPKAVPHPDVPPVEAPAPAPAGQSSRRSPAEKQPPQTRKENYLGIFTQPLPPAIAAQFSASLKKGHGLLVLRVLPDSPADRADLKPYDILVTYDGQALTSVPQLKRLVLRDEPRSTVELEVIRSAKRRTVKLTLDERLVPAGRQSSATGRVIRLGGRNAIVVRLNRVNGADARLRNTDKAGDKPATERSPHRSVTVITGSGNTCQVQIAYRDETGRSRRQRFQGTPDELKSRLDDLPPHVRDNVRRTLNRVGRTQNRPVAFRFQVQPQVDGDRRGLRVTVTRPQTNGTVRFAEVYHPLEDDEPLQADDLLEMDAVADELNQLSPAIRSKVVGTLRSLRVPEVRLDVEQLQ